MLNNNELLLAEEIVSVCKRLHARNLLAAADGNVSYKINNDKIIITPSGVQKALMQPDQMAIINLEGQVILGAPSSEMLMHLQIYKDCPKAKSVVHAHPPTGVAWTVAHPELEYLPRECLSEVILALGEVPIVPYAPPGSQKMGLVLKPYLPKNRALLLARHGAITWGESLQEAFMGMERVEHVSEILFKAKLLGGLTSLPPQDVEDLKLQRKKMGDRLL